MTPFYKVYNYTSTKLIVIHFTKSTCFNLTSTKKYRYMELARIKNKCPS